MPIQFEMLLVATTMNECVLIVTIINGYTTGNGYFAECQKHSAKLQKHSAKPLPSVALGKGHTEERMSAKRTLPSAFRRALGKAFAERKVLHSAKFKRRDGAGT
jgi:hypothetical protein